MKLKASNLLFIAMVLLIAVAAVLLRQHRTAAVDALPDAQMPPWALQVAAVKQGALTQGFPALATLNGSTEITVSSQLSGQILSMGPREGVAVNKGDVLATLSVEELQQQLAGLSAQRDAANAERKRTADEYHRQQALKTKGLTTQELVEAKHAAAIAAERQVVNLDKQIAAAKVRIGYGTVYVPQDAVVAARLMEPGDIALPGKPLYRLTVDSAARLRVSLPQQVLEQIHPGSEVVLSHGSAVSSVRLSRVFPQLDARALGAAEADLDRMPFGLASGSRLPARVILKRVEGALIVPHHALVSNGDEGFVFRVVEKAGHHYLQRLHVHILLSARDGVAVSGHLQAGDQLVVGHQSVLLQLSDGDPVVVSGRVSS